MTQLGIPTKKPHEKAPRSQRLRRDFAGTPGRGFAVTSRGPLMSSGAHVWVRVEGSEAVLGLSDYLQDQMGEITRLELSDLGDAVRAGRRMGHVESEKATSPLEAPLTGEVVEVNPDALGNPDLIKADPYGAGWLLRLRIEDPRELDELINEDDYAEPTTEV